MNNEKIIQNTTAKATTLAKDVPVLMKKIGKTMPKIKLWRGIFVTAMAYPDTYIQLKIER